MAAKRGQMPKLKLQSYSGKNKMSAYFGAF